MTNVKITLILISAMFVVAAAYPVGRNFNQLASMMRAKTCSSGASFYHDGKSWDFEGCTSYGGRRCISGDVPKRGCSSSATNCGSYYWYESNSYWIVTLCKLPGGIDCYKPDGQNAAFDCSVVSQQEALMQSGATSDCTCIKDKKGDKVCEPANCDSLSMKLQDQDNFARILEDDTDCVCMKQGDGPKVCQPPNCDAGRPARF